MNVQLPLHSRTDLPLILSRRPSKVAPTASTNCLSLTCAALLKKIFLYVEEKFFCEDFTLANVSTPRRIVGTSQLTPAVPTTADALVGLHFDALTELDPGSYADGGVRPTCILFRRSTHR
jgi:hypothetical protein